MLGVRINGRDLAFDGVPSVLEALRQAGIQIPTLCHDARLKPYGGCRLCIVEIQGFTRPVTACTMPLVEGMAIETHTPQLQALRRTLLKLLVQEYPVEAARQADTKEFHSLLREYGLEGEAYVPRGSVLYDDTHPYIRVDMARCIDCFRCVRICEELQGQFTWRVWHRGAESRIIPDSGTTLLESTCVSCGACVDTCPTGALEDKSVLAHGRPTVWTKTTCPYCGTGCDMLVGTRENRMVRVAPAQDSPVAKGHLCVKGRYAFDFVYAPDRLTAPMIRKGDGWMCVSWDEALIFAAERLRRILEQHGPHAVGVLGSSRATNEENYLTQKFARVVLGTNNVDCCARVCHAPTASAMKITLGTGAATNSFDDIERARAILVCGANPTENHPVVGARIKQQALRGTPLLVIDPRRIELAEHAVVHLALRPGTNVPLLNAMACTIIEEGLCDEAFLHDRVTGGEAYREFVSRYAPEKVSEICGVDPALIRKAARIYARGKPAMSVHGLGMTEHAQGTEGVICLVNLALLTGNVGRPGAGVNPLRGQNNVQGAAHMGCEPNHLTGFVSLPEGKALFESVWGLPVPTKKGKDLMEMLDAAGRGELKALWLIGYDVLLTNTDTRATECALRNLELVIVQDLFLNETAKTFGTLFLPTASSFEKDGTFMNAERRVQRVRKTMNPLGETRSDWEIICLLAHQMGKGEAFAYTSSEEIWNEIRRVWRAGSGITYERLEGGGIQWPCPTEDHPGTELLHGETFPHGKQTELRCIDYQPTAEVTSEEFPYLLSTGRVLSQFNAGTMTMRTPNSVFRPEDILDVSPQDAERLGLRDGDCVRCRSRYGETVLPAKVNPAVKPGELFATFHTAQVFLNRVTGPHRDAYTHTPEYKVTAVRLEKMDDPVNSA
jgi:formate dehydrogenase major subunit